MTYTMLLSPRFRTITYYNIPFRTITYDVAVANLLDRPSCKSHASDGEQAPPARLIITQLITIIMTIIIIMIIIIIIATTIILN